MYAGLESQKIMVAFYVLFLLNGNFPFTFPHWGSNEGAMKNEVTSKRHRLIIYSAKTYPEEFL